MVRQELENIKAQKKEEEKEAAKASLSGITKAPSRDGLFSLPEEWDGFMPTDFTFESLLVSQDS